MTAANALLAAVFQRLSTDAALTAKLGENRIHDRLLPRPLTPCIAFGEMETRDYSAGDEPGEEHFLNVEIWSEEEGRRQAQEISFMVRALLHDAALTLDGATLVNLRHVSSRSRRSPKTRLFLTELRLRAVTE